MSDHAQGSSPGGLTFSDNISITWELVEQPPDQGLLAMVNESNESFLRAVAAISSFSSDSSEDDVAITQEIARLDLKVNMLLDLVSQLLYRQLEIPPPTRVTVSASEIQWQASEVPAPGATVYIQLYIQHGTPKPLCFYGQVITDDAEYEKNRAVVEYLGLCGSAQSWLEKLIFTHHRREVAYQRSRDAGE